METGDCIAILSVIVCIISILVAIVAIMFGYNIVIFKKKINNRINNIKKEYNNDLENLRLDFEGKLSKCQKDIVAFDLIQHGIYEFIDNEIKSGLASHKNGIMSLQVALDKSAELGNPYISVSVLNQITKVLAVTHEEDFKGVDGIVLFDYKRIISESIDRNIKIVEDANMLDLLIEADGNPQYIRDFVKRLVKVYQ